MTKATPVAPEPAKGTATKGKVKGKSNGKTKGVLKGILKGMAKGGTGKGKGVEVETPENSKVAQGPENTVETPPKNGHEGKTGTKGKTGGKGKKGDKGKGNKGKGNKGKGGKSKVENKENGDEKNGDEETGEHVEENGKGSGGTPVHSPPDLVTPPAHVPVEESQDCFANVFWCIGNVYTPSCSKNKVLQEVQQESGEKGPRLDFLFDFYI